MTSEAMVRAMFLLAGIDAVRVWRLPNGYLGELEPLTDDQIARDAPGFAGVVDTGAVGPTSGVVRSWMADYRWRHARPAWLVLTAFGPVEIGWRKRVIAIDWRETRVRAIVTADSTTKTETMVHAWTEDDALRYLRELAARARAAVDLADPYLLSGADAKAFIAAARDDPAPRTVEPRDRAQRVESGGGDEAG